MVVLGILAVSYFNFRDRSKAEVKTQDVPSPQAYNIPTAGKYCFVRTEKATVDAPYSVEEHVVLNFDGVKVSGTKRGTQSGPDMTNGYEGTLIGATIDNEMELTYAYTVEGSKNRELEVYTFDKENLIKKRWVLHEGKINGVNILLPDYVGEPMLIAYQPEGCI